MNLYFDTEFTGLHQNTTLISLGIVDENDRSFYAEFTSYDINQIDQWIKLNVLNNLKFNIHRLFDNNNITNLEMKDSSYYIYLKLIEWLKYYEKNNMKVDIWSDCLAYDWILFNELFGGALQIPSFINYIPFDICTLFKLKNIDPDISREEFSGMNGVKHNSLYDAKVIRECYRKLIIL